MNRTDLIKFISHDIGYPQASVVKFLDALTSHIKKAVEIGDHVEIRGLLRIKVKRKPARTGRNHRTGAAIEIPAKNVVKVTAAKALNDAVN